MSAASQHRSRHQKVAASARKRYGDGGFGRCTGSDPRFEGTGLVAPPIGVDRRHRCLDGRPWRSSERGRCQTLGLLCGGRSRLSRLRAISPREMSSCSCRLGGELALSGLFRSLFDGLSSRQLTPLDGGIEAGIPQPHQPPLDPP